MSRTQSLRHGMRFEMTKAANRTGTGVAQEITPAQILMILSDGGFPFDV